MKILNWVLFFVAVLGLISVRLLENKLFYDPFLDFFKGNYKVNEIPKFVWEKLIISHFFRFLLNLFFSALVIHFMFLNKKWTQQAIVLIALAFLFFFPIYLWCLYTKMEIGFLFTFSVRRFVIQPIILLLIIPIFYYRKKLMKL